jgi:hypothetical protein
MALDIGLIGVNVIINVIFTVIVVFVLIRKVAVPVLTALIEDKTEETQNMMKAAASALGNKSVEAREMKKMEKMMVGDIMEQYPEIEMALEYFSPDTADLIRKHPQRALTLLTRYKPIIDQILGREGAQKEPWQL